MVAPALGQLELSALARQFVAPLEARPPSLVGVAG